MNSLQDVQAAAAIQRASSAMVRFVSMPHPAQTVANIDKTLGSWCAFFCFHRVITTGTPHDRRVIYTILHSPGPAGLCISPKMNFLLRPYHGTSASRTFGAQFRAFG